MNSYFMFLLRVLSRDSHNMVNKLKLLLNWIVSNSGSYIGLGSGSPIHFIVYCNIIIFYQKMATGQKRVLVIKIQSIYSDKYQKKNAFTLYKMFSSNKYRTLIIWYSGSQIDHVMLYSMNNSWYNFYSTIIFRGKVKKVLCCLIYYI